MPSKLDLSYVFNLPPEKAIAYFRAKNYTFTWNWYDILANAKRLSFTVAKVTRLDVLESIYEMVDKAISDGISYDEFRDTLEPQLKAKGWWGYVEEVNPKTGELERILGGSPWRLRTIYQTNLQSSYMAGRYRQFKENIEDRPYAQYIQLDRPTKRPEHALLDGKIFRVDSAEAQVIWPPNGYNCACRMRALSDIDLERKGLSVESSSLIQDDFLISEKSGESATVQGIKLSDGTTMYPDVGFDHNPGEDPFEPDLSQYRPELRAQYK